MKTGESTHMGVRHSISQVLGAAGKAGLASMAAVTDALGCKGPPPAPFIGGPEMGFNLKQGREAAAAAGAGPSGARLLIAAAMPGTGEVVGAEVSGGLADRPALPDTEEEVGVSKVRGAEGRECEEVPGRGCGREKRRPGELCCLSDKGCTEEAPLADARMSTGAGESCFLPHLSSCGTLLGSAGTAGREAASAAGRRKGQEGCVAPRPPMA